MTTLAYSVKDSTTMLRRSLLHMRRYPSMTLSNLAIPAIFLLLFVYVFGETMGAGLGEPSGGRAEYLRYVLPGILVMTVAAASVGTAITVAMDMTEGIIARFRTMAIFRPSVMTGHVLGSMIKTMINLVVVIGLAILLGFRPSATGIEWIAAVGTLVVITLAFTWLTVAFGLIAPTAETASNLPTPLVFLPFLGSGFVPTESLPIGLRWFAEYQPFTPFIDTLRGLLTDAAIGSSAIVSVLWCAGITLFGYLWARSAYNRDGSH
jgi:ABC-2 type transport system permease protein